jgi:hypothetical protein
MRRKDTVTLLNLSVFLHVNAFSGLLTEFGAPLKITHNKNQTHITRQRDCDDTEVLAALGSKGVV